MAHALAGEAVAAAELRRRDRGPLDAEGAWVAALQEATRQLDAISPTVAT